MIFTNVFKVFLKVSLPISAVFDEFTFEGIHPRSNTGEFLLKKGTPLFSKASGGVEVLKRYPEIQETAVPTVGQGVEVLHHYPDVEVKSKKDRSKPVLIGEEAVTFPIPTMEHIPASPSTPTFRKGFVHEMAKKFEWVPNLLVFDGAYLSLKVRRP